MSLSVCLSLCLSSSLSFSMNLSFFFSLPLFSLPLFLCLGLWPLFLSYSPLEPFLSACGFVCPLTRLMALVANRSSIINIISSWARGNEHKLPSRRDQENKRRSHSIEHLLSTIGTEFCLQKAWIMKSLKRSVSMGTYECRLTLSPFLSFSLSHRFFYDFSLSTFDHTFLYTFRLLKYYLATATTLQVFAREKFSSSLSSLVNCSLAYVLPLEIHANLNQFDILECICHAILN